MSIPRADPCPTLAALKHGERALVVHIDHRDPKVVAKLAARGVVPGVELRVVRGGDPLLIALDDSRWALTRHDADLIQVDVLFRPRKSLLGALLS